MAPNSAIMSFCVGISNMLKKTDPDTPASESSPDALCLSLATTGQIFSLHNHFNMLLTTTD